MILYSFFRSSAAYRVRIAMNLKGLKPEQRFIHLGKKLNRLPEYKAINPQGFVPYLLEGDGDDQVGLAQSLAIIEYLDEIQPQPPLLPATPMDRAFARSIAQIIACDIHPLNNPRVLDVLTGDFNVSSERKTQWYCGWIHDGFTAIEKMLVARDKKAARKSTFCAGDFPTVADICLIPQVNNANRFKCALDAFPRIMEIYDNAMKHPAFDAAQPAKQPDAE